jgi:hypothetical protein
MLNTVNSLDNDEKLGNNIIFQLSNIIRDDDIDSIKDILPLIPVDKFHKIFRSSILHDLLVTCYNHDRSQIAKIILRRFTDPYYNIEDFAPAPPMSLYTSLYLDPGFDTVLLLFIASLYPEYGFVRCVDELAHINNDPNIPIAMDKLFNVYGEYPLRALLNILDGIPKTADLIREVLRDRIRQVNKFADIPPYMISEKILISESKLDYYAIQNKETEYKNILPPLDELAEMIFYSMEDTGFMYEDKQIVIEKLMFILAVVPYEKKVIMAEQVIGKLSDMDKKIREQYKYNIDYDKMLFRLYGPSNPFFSFDTIDDIDFLSPRMLEDTKGQSTEDVEGSTLAEVESPDWFIGSCLHCDLRIRRRWHAVRIPYSFGSWKGCYCSWSCAHDEVLEKYENPIYELILIEIMREMFEDPNSGYDILDRIPDSEYPEYLKELTINTNTTNIIMKDFVSYDLKRLDNQENIR